METRQAGACAGKAFQAFPCQFVALDSCLFVSSWTWFGYLFGQFTPKARVPGLGLVTLLDTEVLRKRVDWKSITQGSVIREVRRRVAC